MNKKLIIRIEGTESVVIFCELSAEEAQWLCNELNNFKPGTYCVRTAGFSGERGTLYDVETEIFSRFQEMFRESKAAACEDVMEFQAQ